MKKRIRSLVVLALVVLALVAAWRFNKPLAQSQSPTAGSQQDTVMAQQDAARGASAPSDTAASNPATPATTPASNLDGQPAQESANTTPPAPQISDDTIPNQNASSSLSPTCTVSIDCQTVLEHTDLLPAEKISLVPSDGLLLPDTAVAFNEGATVFDILEQVARDQKLHLEFEKTPAYQSVYIEGIGNLYEFDCGELSGWIYSVNGVFSPGSCSQVPVKDGDIICWFYTCDLGADVGALEV